MDSKTKRCLGHEYDSSAQQGGSGIKKGSNVSLSLSARTTVYWETKVDSIIAEFQA